MTRNGVVVATELDVPTMLDILEEARQRLHAAGVDQWPRRFGPDRVARDVEDGTAYLVCQDGEAVATFMLNARADADFWTADEQRDSARYMSKLATRAGHPGLGSAVLDWCSWSAAQEGAKWVRLDAWRSNTALLAYYLRNGFEHLRTVERSHRNSGALFQRPAIDIVTPAMRRYRLA